MQKNLEVMASEPEPRARHELSLYGHISNIKWDDYAKLSKHGRSSSSDVLTFQKRVLSRSSRIASEQRLWLHRGALLAKLRRPLECHRGPWPPDEVRCKTQPTCFHHCSGRGAPSHPGSGRQGSGFLGRQQHEK